VKSRTWANIFKWYLCSIFFTPFFPLSESIKSVRHYFVLEYVTHAPKDPCGGLRGQCPEHWWPGGSWLLAHATMESCPHINSGGSRGALVCMELFSLSWGLAPKGSRRANERKEGMLDAHWESHPSNQSQEAPFVTFPLHLILKRPILCLQLPLLPWSAERAPYCPQSSCGPDLI
jgi:hypothetical protein